MRKWCSQWKLHIRLREVGGDSSLVHQLNSVSDHTRMYAVAAVSVLAENQAVLALKPRPLSGLLLESSASPRPPTPWTERQVSAELVRELERLLSDSAVHVRVPSAITLYCLDRQTEKAREVSGLALVHTPSLPPCRQKKCCMLSWWRECACQSAGPLCSAWCVPGATSLLPSSLSCCCTCLTPGAQQSKRGPLHCWPGPVAER